MAKFEVNPSLAEWLNVVPPGIGTMFDLLVMHLCFLTSSVIPFREGPLTGHSGPSVLLIKTRDLASRHDSGTCAAAFPIPMFLQYSEFCTRGRRKNPAPTGSRGGADTGPLGLGTQRSRAGVRKANTPDVHLRTNITPIDSCSRSYYAT